MSIQLVTTDHEDRLQEILEGTEANLRIISPFIGLEISKRLAAILEINPAIACEIITRFSREDFVNGASNLYYSVARQIIINSVIPAAASEFLEQSLPSEISSEITADNAYEKIFGKFKELAKR